MKKITKSIKRLFLLLNIAILVSLTAFIVLFIKRNYLYMALAGISVVFNLYLRVEWKKSYNELIEKFS
ncbi:putative membrane protein [[Clostridium] bifermentans ATCC 638]|uniref:Putative membrane protein n=1 Tax=Paraclostridium bifermentans ATCC 638 = DSM 14991 TaxID=1233171 RepID=T4VKD4_PARBF|nr:hypothetical protein [Paraclostridium bifermentans]EQK44154.1 putative membrane protein [[Clostridium] bifermentans ATCC 638] [Paraclostridium bifermentans ATCC 638 = DSM 14991]RIZ58596.1 hypothetical protein CHH45_10835 [Paraclostridium bifermentans]UAG19893.1 hypothetical protein KXZ80_16360 [Paraclostridium bifermentans]